MKAKARAVESSPSAALAWVKPPQQTRSQKTLERLLDAAEELLLEGGADAVTVAQVTQRAGSSVGAFYARFPDKEALLRSVFERFHHEAVATVEQALAPERWQGMPLSTILEATLRFTVQVFRERRHLIAAIAVRADRDSELGPVAERLGTLIAEHFSALLEASGQRPHHPDPAQAVRFSTWLILSALESRALHGGSSVVADDELIAELIRLCFAYFGLDPASSPSPAPRQRGVAATKKSSQNTR